LVARTPAGDGRIELEGLDPDLGEACLGEQVLEFLGGSGGGASGGAGAAGLRGERDASSGPEQAPQVVEPSRRIGPEPHGVDGEDGIERFVEAWQPVHGSVDEFDTLGADGGVVAPARLVDHDLRVVDAVDVASGGAVGELGDGEAGAEADLEHPVLGLHLEQ
jgi:hypothetical protein